MMRWMSNDQAREINKTFNVVVQGAPQLAISNITIDPDLISPKDRFNITFLLSNEGTGIARDAKISAATSGLPFVPAGADTKIVKNLQPGESVQMNFPLLVKDKTVISSYSIPIKMDYKDEIGKNMSSQSQLSLLLAYKSITKGNKGTLILTIFIMSLIFVNLVFTASIFLGLGNTVDNQVINTLYGNIAIEPKKDEKYINDVQTLEQKINSVPGVTGISPQYVIGAAFSYKDKSGAWAIRSINPDDEMKVTTIHKFMMVNTSAGWTLMRSSLEKRYLADTAAILNIFHLVALR